MAEQEFQVNCGFFKAMNNDRLYSADDMNKPYKRLVTNGVFATQKGTPSNDLQVFSANNGMDIIVKKGEGIFDNKWFENPSDIVITVAKNNSIVPRIDSVVARINKKREGRKGSIVLVQGIEASNAQPPEINIDEDIIDYRLANIYVSANSNTITQEVITDLRGSEECLWVTSLIKQVDTSTLFVQYQDWLRRVTGEAEANLNNMQEEFENSFNTWFQTVQDILDGDTAGHLLNLIDDNALRCRTITLDVENWIQNETTQNYEYNIEDITITENHLVQGHMDLENQAKMSDGYIETYNGGFKIITSEIPNEQIVMNLSLQKAGGII